MIKSMTGYGRGEAAMDGRSATAEIRSVNHRYCEVSARLPGRYGFAEDAVKQLAKKCAGRGKVDILIGFTSTNEEDALVTLNTAVARQYFSGLRELQKSFDTTGEISLELLASMPDILRQERPQADEETIEALILEATEAALIRFDHMRIAEGAELKADMEIRLDRLKSIAKTIEKRAPEVRDAYIAKLQDRIAALSDIHEGDALLEQRLAIEIAIFADKASIDEELVRLASHIDQFKNAIKDDGDGEPVGKKLDFIVQEMNREANTIGSKANDLHITDLMIALKTDIENIREQIQNIA
ncbi:MAG: YicC family protein [Clostridiales bacterium]|nr:YicC family protein [Clostridiales bacterium]